MVAWGAGRQLTCAMHLRRFTWAQIEGAWNTSGKAPSIWDALVREQGKIKNGASGDVAIDHFNRCATALPLLRCSVLQCAALAGRPPRAAGVLLCAAQKVMYVDVRVCLGVRLADRSKSLQRR